MKKITIVGFGFMGAIHAKNILANKNLKLCAIIDKRKNIFAEIENTYNMSKLFMSRLKKIPVYQTLEECCRAENPDVALICVPLFLHYDLTKRALNLGLDVLLEKPFCPEPEQCRELIELAKEKKRILMVAHCIRFAPTWEFLADCIKNKRYGKLKLFTTTRMGGEPTWGIWQDKKIKNTCGGALLDLLIHDIDFANYCLGSPQTVKLNLNKDDYWEFELKYHGESAKVSVKGGFLYRHTVFASEYVATFEKGSIRYSSLQPQIIHIGIDTGAEIIKVKGDAYYAELEYFTKCCETRMVPTKCLPEDSLKAIKTCRQI